MIPLVRRCDHWAKRRGDVAFEIEPVEDRRFPEVDLVSPALVRHPAAAARHRWMLEFGGPTHHQLRLAPVDAGTPDRVAARAIRCVDQRLTVGAPVETDEILVVP